MSATSSGNGIVDPSLTISAPPLVADLIYRWSLTECNHFSAPHPAPLHLVQPDCPGLPGAPPASSSCSSSNNPPLPPIFCHLEPIRTEEIVRLRNEGGGIAIVEHPPSAALTVTGRTINAAPLMKLAQSILILNTL